MKLNNAHALSRIILCRRWGILRTVHVACFRCPVTHAMNLQ